MSLCRLPERRRLADQYAEAGMADFQDEREAAIATLGMGHGHGAGRQPPGQRETPAEDFKEITFTAKHQRAVAHADTKRHAKTVPKIFFDAGRPGEAFGGMDDLRKSAAPGIEPRPNLASGRHVLGNGHHARHSRVARRRQGPADYSRHL